MSARFQDNGYQVCFFFTQTSIDQCDEDLDRNHGEWNFSWIENIAHAEARIFVQIPLNYQANLCVRKPLDCIQISLGITIYIFCKMMNDFWKKNTTVNNKKATLFILNRLILACLRVPNLSSATKKQRSHLNAIHIKQI